MKYIFLNDFGLEEWQAKTGTDEVEFNDVQKQTLDICQAALPFTNDAR